MDIRQQSIIKYSDIILEYLLKYKETHPDFTFSLRQRDFAKSDSPKRLENGQWFQGSDYIFVPLFKIGDSARKIKTLGYALNFDKNGNITSSTITISFKGGVTDKKDVDLHKKLAKEIGIKLNPANCGDYFFGSPTSITENLDYYLNTVRPIAISLINKYKLVDKYTFTETDFQKYLARVNEIRDANPQSYWIFQGNPKYYDVVGALQDDAITTWKVATHKDKIKKGDKVILWLTGEKPGCYALAEVTSEVGKIATNDKEIKYYLGDYDDNEDRVFIKIKYNLVLDPLMWDTIKQHSGLNKLKVGNQGTNFSATKEEYESILKLISKMNKLIINISWNSKDWKEESQDKSNHQWVKNGGIPFESWNFASDAEQHTQEYLFGYAKFTNNPKITGKSIFIFYSDKKIVGFYGNGAIVEKKVEDNILNLRGDQNLSFVLENKIENIFEKGYLEDGKRIGQGGFNYLRKNETVIKILDEALNLNPNHYDQ